MSYQGIFDRHSINNDEAMKIEITYCSIVKVYNTMVQCLSFAIYDMN